MGVLARLKQGWQAIKPVTASSVSLLSHSYYPVGPARRRNKAPKETTKKAAFAGLLCPSFLFFPKSHHYPSLSSCANVFSPIKTNHIRGDPFSVTVGGCRTLWGAWFWNLGLGRDQDYQRMRHGNSRAALVRGITLQSSLPFASLLSMFMKLSQTIMEKPWTFADHCWLQIGI